MKDQKNVSEYYHNIKEKMSSIMNVGSILDKCELDGHLF